MATIANLIVNIEAQTANLVTGIDRANAKIDSIGGIAAKAGGLISGAFTATAIIGFAEHVADAASEIHDMAERIGVSAEAVQRFKFAADQTGATIDDVGRSINFMNRTLYEGNQGLVPLLERAHLTFADLQKMKPEDAFLAISEAIKQIPDPMLQAELATKLFGKTGQVLLPAIKEGVRALGAQTVVMSTDTVNSLDDAKDVWEKLANSVTIYSAKLIAAAMSDLNVWKRMKQDLDDLGLSAVAIAKAPAPPLLTAPGIQQIHLSDDALKDVTDTLNKQRDALDKAAEKAREHADAIGRIRDQLTGRGAIRAALDMTEALRGALPIEALDDEAKKRINKTMGEALDAYRRFGQMAPEAIGLAYIKTTELAPAVAGLRGEFEHVGVTLEKFVIPTTYDYANALHYVAGIPAGEKIGAQFDIVTPKVIKTRDELGLLGQSLAQLSQIAGGAFGGIAQGFATMISSIETAKRSVGSFKDGLSDWKSGSTWDGILGMTTGILGITSAAITAVKAIASLFDRNKGRDLVLDFAANFGGINELHDLLLKGGEAGEKLWIALTQGVGRNNPEQAKQVIAEVQRFLDELGRTVVTPTIAPHVEWPDNMPSEPPDTDPGYASGTPGLGFVNFRTRTPTWLHGDEAVVPRHKVGDLAAQIAAAMGGGGGDSEIHVYIGNEELDGRIVKVARKDAAKGGTRQRATVGRSY